MASVFIDPIVPKEEINEVTSAESIAPIPAPKKRSRKKVEEIEQPDDPSPIEEPEITLEVPRATEPVPPVATKAPPSMVHSASEEPKKRGRPKGSKNVEKSKAQSTHVAPPEIVAPARRPSPEIDSANGAAQSDIETHLVNYLLERKTREVNNRRNAWKSLGHLAVGGW